MKTKANASRIASLDGLRGIAACGVAFLYHPLLHLPADIMTKSGAPAFWLAKWGWTFVDLFFLISGYVFAHVYLAGTRLTRDALGTFLSARFARLYPLHLVMLLICAGLFGTARANTWPTFMANLVLAQAFVAGAGRSFDPPSWSISVEVVCYTVFALAAIRGDRVLRRVSIVILVLGSLRLFPVHQDYTFEAIDSLARGLFGFFLGQMLWRYRLALRRVPVWGLLLVIVGGIAPGFPFPIIALSWPAALCLAMRLRPLGSWPLSWLGDRSYAIYLLHLPILYFIVPMLEAEKDAALTVAYLLGYAIFVLVLADFTYRYFELPARKAIRGLAAARPRPPELHPLQA